MGKIKAILFQNELGVIRKCWRWGMENGLIPLSPKLLFHGENLITDDKVFRDTCEANDLERIFFLKILVFKRQK